MTYNPLPPVQTTETGHSTECVSKDTTKCTREHGTTEKDGDSLVDLITSVPSSQEEIQTGEEPCFEETKAETHSEELLVCLDESHCANVSLGIAERRGVASLDLLNVWNNAHAIMVKGIHLDGRNFFRIILEGTSNAT